MCICFNTSTNRKHIFFMSILNEETLPCDLCSTVFHIVHSFQFVATFQKHGSAKPRLLSASMLMLLSLFVLVPCKVKIKSIFKGQCLASGPQKSGKSYRFYFLLKAMQNSRIEVFLVGAWAVGEIPDLMYVHVKAGQACSLFHEFSFLCFRTWNIESVNLVSDKSCKKLPTV